MTERPRWRTVAPGGALSSALNMLVLRPSGTIALWSKDDVENGWALTAEEARGLAAGCDAAVAQGLGWAKVGEYATGEDIRFEGESAVLTQIGANLRTLADVSDSILATKQ